MLHIRLLGGLRVEAPDGRAVDLATAGRGGALLGWLALNPGTHSRSEVAARFWPDVLDTSARASLRNALWTIRRAIGDEATEGLIATRDRVGLDQELIWVDAAAFAEHLEAGRLDDALALARGELLADVDEEWVYEYRDAHRERLAELFEGLAKRAEFDDDPTGAVAWSRRAAALDLLAEGPHRALFARMAAAGDRAGAILAYDKLRQRLAADLAMSPSEETRLLAESLRAHEPAGSPATTPTARAIPPDDLPSRLAQAAATPWVGRQDQLGRLRAEFERALRGDSAVLMITGEGGIGKTRLAAELAKGAQGCAVLYGRCDEGELFPFGPFIEMIGGHLAALPDSEIPAVLGEAGPELARMLPELRTRIGDVTVGSGQDPEVERARLFAAVVAVIARLAERYPLVCIVDDLHWADQSSLLLGRHVARATGLGRVLLVGTYRDTELHDQHPLVEALADLERDGPTERIALTGLGGDEVAELAAAHDQDLGETAVRAIQEETQGNPFFVKQLLRHIEEEGAAPGQDGFVLPAGLRDVLVRRVARLPGRADEVLRAASLMGREFELDLLESIMDMPEEEVLDALDAAVRGGILVEIDGAPGRYSFVHALMRTNLENGLTATRRSRLHARIGGALEGLRPDDPAVLDDLARHFVAAGPHESPRAVDYAERAAEQAARRLAYEDAIRLVADALAAHERAASSNPAERARLLNALAAAQLRAGHHQDARATYTEAVEAARAAGIAELLAGAALGHAGGMFDRYGTADPESAALLREALDALPTEDSGLRAQALARLSGVLYYSPGDEETAKSLADDAIQMARRLGDDETLVAALLAAQQAGWRPGELNARLELAGELLEATKHADDLVAEAFAHFWTHGALLQLCRRNEADAARAAQAELAERLRLPTLTFHARASLATNALLNGRWDEAEAEAEAIVDMGERSTALDVLYTHAAIIGTLLGHQLRLGELLGELELVTRQATEFPGWHGAIALAHAQAGDPDLAFAELEDLRRDGFAIVRRDANFDVSMAWVSYAAVELADVKLAAEVEPLLRPLENQWVIMGLGAAELGPIAYSLGMLNLVLDRHEPAAPDFERALRLSRNMQSPPYEAHSLLGLSKAVQPTDPDRARKLRDQAIAIAAELGGMDRLLRDAGAA